MISIFAVSTICLQLSPWACVLKAETDLSFSNHASCVSYSLSCPVHNTKKIAWAITSANVIIPYTNTISGCKFPSYCSKKISLLIIRHFLTVLPFSSNGTQETQNRRLGPQCSAAQHRFWLYQAEFSQPLAANVQTVPV